MQPRRVHDLLRPRFRWHSHGLTVLLIVMATIGLLISSAGVAHAATTVTWGQWKFYYQEKSNICWAAASKSVVHRVTGVEYTQCSLVNAGLKTTGCPNQTGTVYDIDRAIKAMGVTHTTVSPSGRPAWANLRTWTTTNGGAITGAVWGSGGAHAVPIAGTDLASTNVYVVKISTTAVTAQWYPHTTFNAGSSTIFGQPFTVQGFVGAWR